MCERAYPSKLTILQVFDNPRASDPTHSVIAKDHVDLILNEPAGKISQVVVEHTVNLIVRVSITGF